MLRNKTFAPEICSLISNWFDMREQAPGAKLFHDSVSGASSFVCTEICFAGACCRSKLPRVYWLEYLPGSMFRERVSGASFFLCTGWSTYPGACFGSVFREQAPSCVLKFALGERVAGASSLVCTGWGTYPGACFGSVFQEQAPSCVPAFRHVHVWMWAYTFAYGVHRCVFLFIVMSICPN